MTGSFQTFMPLLPNRSLKKPPCSKMEFAGEIVADRFSGLTGLFDRVCDKHRSSVLLDLLGQQVKTVIATEKVTAAA